jgi:hypothetical protein
MNGVGACGSRDHHFTPEEDEALRKDPSTSQILNAVRSDAHVGGPRVEVRGDDRTWRATKEEQNHMGRGGWTAVTHTGLDAAHLAEFGAVEKLTAEGVGAAVAGGLVIVGALGGFALGVHEWNEAHLKGEEQNAALARDELHVAMLTQLELPQGYKTEQLAQRAQAGQSAQSTAQKMATPFATLDKPLVAAMQLHADRGMHAARDLLEAGTTKAAFFAANPKVAEAYTKDAAFHDGFDALVWAHEQKAQGAYKDALAKLTERDCWYSQSNVNYRI